MENKRSLFFSSCRNKHVFFYCLIFFCGCSCFCAMFSVTNRLDIRCYLSAGNENLYLQDVYDSSREEEKVEVLHSTTRRLLSGPGSSPPRCASRCGKCTPCKPVHVSVPPGASMTAEYYPEAWRCKCGKKLYMP